LRIREWVGLSFELFDCTVRFLPTDQHRGGDARCERAGAHALPWLLGQLARHRLPFMRRHFLDRVLLRALVGHQDPRARDGE